MECKILVVSIRGAGWKLEVHHEKVERVRKLKVYTLEFTVFLNYKLKTVT